MQGDEGIGYEQMEGEMDDMEGEGDYDDEDDMQ